MDDTKKAVVGSYGDNHKSEERLARMKMLIEELGDARGQLFSMRIDRCWKSKVKAAAQEKGLLEHMALIEDELKHLQAAADDE